MATAYVLRRDVAGRLQDAEQVRNAEGEARYLEVLEADWGNLILVSVAFLMPFVLAAALMPRAGGVGVVRFVVVSIGFLIGLGTAVVSISEICILRFRRWRARSARRSE